jgi:hypothetical protein
LPVQPDYLKRIRIESVARCEAGWIAVGLDSDLARHLADNPAIGAAEPAMIPDDQRPLVIITGEQGAGKSLIGERILQSWAQDYRAGGPAPVFLEVVAGETASLETLLIGAADLDVRRRGLCAVVDVSEASAAQGARTIRQARALVRGWPRTRIVLLARPTEPFAYALDEAESIVGIVISTRFRCCQIIEYRNSHSSRVVTLKCGTGSPGRSIVLLRIVR